MTTQYLLLITKIAGAPRYSGCEVRFVDYGHKVTSSPATSSINYVCIIVQRDHSTDEHEDHTEMIDSSVIYVDSQCLKELGLVDC